MVLGWPRPPAALRPITDARIVREFPSPTPFPRLGYDTTGWTVVLLACIWAGDRSRSPARTLRRRMHDLGCAVKWPRYVYAEKDPHPAQKKGG